MGAAASELGFIVHGSVEHQGGTPNLSFAANGRASCCFSKTATAYRNRPRTVNDSPHTLVINNTIWRHDPWDVPDPKGKFLCKFFCDQTKVFRHSERRLVVAHTAFENHVDQRATSDLVKHDDNSTSRCKRDALDPAQCKFIIARSKLHQQETGSIRAGLCEGIGLAKFVGMQRAIPPNSRRHFARFVEKIAPLFYIACVIEGAAPQSE